MISKNKKAHHPILNTSVAKITPDAIGYRQKSMEGEFSFYILYNFKVKFNISEYLECRQ